MHFCTWQRCGAPATKVIRVRLRYPERIVDLQGKPIPEAADGRDLWRCDPHYEEALAHWANMEELFIVEY